MPTMLEQPPALPPRDVINVVTWNILLDKTRTENEIVAPQIERINSQAKTLMELGVGLDVVMLQEVEGDNGRKIAEMTGHEPGVWQQHNRKNEHIGAFGSLVESAEFYDLGHGKKAVMTRIGNVAVVGVHFVARPKQYFKRVEQARVLCELLDQEEEAIVMGDFNGPQWEEARRMLGRRGFKSAFTQAGLKRPPTYPTEQYRDIMWTPRQQKVLRGQVSIDDIIVTRGVTVKDARSFVGDTDHVGLVAEIAA